MTAVSHVIPCLREEPRRARQSPSPPLRNPATWEISPLRSLTLVSVEMTA